MIQGNRSHSPTRRAIIAAAAASLGGIRLHRLARGDVDAASGAPATFAQRGYYITFMRMPTYGLSAWKSTIDLFAGDGINVVILWMA